MCNNFTLTFHSDCPACFGDNLNALRRRYNSILPTLFCEDWQKSPKLWFPQTSFDLWINVGLNQGLLYLSWSPILLKNVICLQEISIEEKSINKYKTQHYWNHLIVSPKDTQAQIIYAEIAVLFNFTSVFNTGRFSLEVPN